MATRPPPNEQNPRADRERARAILRPRVRLEARPGGLLTPACAAQVAARGAGAVVSEFDATGSTSQGGPLREFDERPVVEHAASREHRVHLFAARRVRWADGRVQLGRSRAADGRRVPGLRRRRPELQEPLPPPRVRDLDVRLPPARVQRRGDGAGLAVGRRDPTTMGSLRQSWTNWQRNKALAASRE